MADDPASRSPRTASQVADAVAAARREERINARLDNHDGEIRELRNNQAATTHTLVEIRTQVTNIERSLAEAAAAAKAVADATAKGLTQRQLYIALGMFLVALIGLLLGVGGAAHV